MAKLWIEHEPEPKPRRPSLAEEQSRAFDEDRKRERKPILKLRFSSMMFRN